jgi:hypothetical protein
MLAIWAPSMENEKATRTSISFDVLSTIDRQIILDFSCHPALGEHEHISTVSTN